MRMHQTMAMLGEHRAMMLLRRTCMNLRMHDHETKVHAAQPYFTVYSRAEPGPNLTSPAGPDVVRIVHSIPILLGGQRTRPTVYCDIIVADCARSWRYAEQHERASLPVSQSVLVVARWNLKPTAHCSDQCSSNSRQSKRDWRTADFPETWQRRGYKSRS